MYLRKTSDALISHCRCAGGLIAGPGQADCPWCGCGWLFACIECRKAFTFAETVEVDESLESIGRRDLHRFFKRPPDEQLVAWWMADMEQLLAGVELGRVYVYLDTVLVPADIGVSVSIAGERRHHTLPWVPQVRALTDRTVLDDVLGNAKYWRRSSTRRVRESRTP